MMMAATTFNRPSFFQYFFLLSLYFLIFVGLSLAQVAPSKTIVYGSGLYSAAAGQPAVFYVQAVDNNGNNLTLCNLPFAAFIYNTTNTSIPNDCNQGQYSFHYNQRIALTYTLRVVYNGVDVGKSPYHPFITPGPVYPPGSVGSGNGLTGGQVGQNVFFTITDYDAYGNRNYSCNLDGSWQARLTGAATIEATIVNCSAGVFTLMYYATVSGSYDIRVSLNGANLQKSPFHIGLNPGPIYAQNVYATGAGASNATAGIITYFKIITRDQFGNFITSCSASGSNFNVYLLYANTRVNATYISCSGGQYSFSYNVTRAVSWQLYIYYLGTKSNSSPTNIAVRASSIIDGDNSIASGVGLTNGTAGVPAPFNIIPFDIYGNQINFCPSSTNYSDWTVSVYAVIDPTVRCTGGVAGCSSGKFNGQYVCFNSTVYTLNVAYQGSTIKGSPYSPYVQPGPIDGHTSIVTGQGLSQAYAGIPATFVINTNDQYNNNINVCLSPLNPTFSITVSAVDIGVSLNGTITSCVLGNYTGQYIITKMSFLYILTINYQGNAVGDSPWDLQTYPGPPYLPYCTATGQGLVSSVAGTTASFSLTCQDQYQNPVRQCYTSQYWNATLTGPATLTANLASCNTNTGPATWIFQYVGYRAGQYNLVIQFTLAKPTLTFKPIVIPAQFSPTNSIAIGPGVTSQNIPAGVNTTFIILSQDAYGNNVTNCINLNQLTIQIRSRDGSVTVYPSVNTCYNGNIPVSWQSTKAGPYYVTIYYQGYNIKNSPYSVAVVAGAIYAPSCVASGPGLTQAVAGVNAPVTLFCSDRYQNPVNYCSANSSWSLSLSGPQQLTGTVPTCSSGTYYGYYVAFKAGKYSFTIRYNGGSIQSSPFSPVVVPGSVSETRSLASGPGFTGAQVPAGNATYLNVQGYDAYGNIIPTCTVTSNYWTASVYFNNSFQPVLTARSTSCQNGIYVIVYYPTKAGLNKVIVTGSSNNGIQNNPGSVLVIPGAFNALNSYVDTFQNMAAGQIDPIWIYSRDNYNNSITQCSLPSNQFPLFAPVASMTGQSYTGKITFCVSGVYQGTIQMNVTGTYAFRVTFGSTPIPSLKQYIYVNSGTPSAQYSIARGPGVDPTQLIVAGTFATFYIDIYNQYGIRIAQNSICQPYNWTVKFVPDMSAFPQNRNVTIGKCSLGTVPVYYNATTAGYYSIYIYGNGNPIRLNPYHSQVIPTYLDPTKTQVEGLLQTFITFGTFTLVGRDIYGNPGVNLTNGIFTVSLSPSCSKSSLCCNFNNGKLECSFWVWEGGRYCVNIDYQGKILPLNTSSLLVYGGLACGSGGCIHGYCYPINPNSPQYSCSCSPGYTGSDCSIPPRQENSSLPSAKTVKIVPVLPEAEDITKLSITAMSDVNHSVHQHSSVKNLVDSSFVLVAIVAGIVFGAYISKRRISSLHPS